MTFHIITIFPKIFDSYFNESIVKRALKKEKIKIKIYNLRDYTTNKHRTIDDTPYGGGAGMVLKVEPIYRCIKAVYKSSAFSTLELSSRVSSKPSFSRIILFSAKGKKYTQADARRLAKYENIILICGRYEGVDERVAKYLVDEEISVGEYILTGGEIPAIILVDSISRLIPGVLGNEDSLAEESFSPVRLRRASADAKFSCEIENFEKICEYPHYTKPADFRGWKVPKVLLSGNHKEIEKWREKMQKSKCKNKTTIQNVKMSPMPSFIEFKIFFYFTLSFFILIFKFYI